MRQSDIYNKDLMMDETNKNKKKEKKVVNVAAKNQSIKNLHRLFNIKQEADGLGLAVMSLDEVLKS